MERIHRTWLAFTNYHGCERKKLWPKRLYVARAMARDKTQWARLSEEKNGTKLRGKPTEKLKNEDEYTKEKHTKNIQNYTNCGNIRLSYMISIHFLFLLFCNIFGRFVWQVIQLLLLFHFQLAFFFLVIIVVGIFIAHILAHHNKLHILCAMRTVKYNQIAMKRKIAEKNFIMENVFVRSD